MWKSTIDIDSNDKKFTSRITAKIRNCPDNVSTRRELSSFKGVHIRLKCKKKCEICRFVYDDPLRFAYDSNRPDYAKNILFQEKEIIRFGI